VTSRGALNGTGSLVTRCPLAGGAHGGGSARSSTVNRGGGGGARSFSVKRGCRAARGARWDVWKRAATGSATSAVLKRSEEVVCAIW